MRPSVGPNPDSEQTNPTWTKAASRPAGMIDEILDERVVSSHSHATPRDVRQKMSGCSLRKRGPVLRRQRLRTPEIVPICA